MSNLPHYTKEQLADIIKQIRAITIQGLPLFDANIVNPHYDNPIALNDIRSSGVVYIKIASRGHVHNFPAWVEIPEQ